MLLWLDLETTGLKASTCAVLEIAAIITDDEFREVARMQRVVYYPHAARIVDELAKQHRLFGKDMSDDVYKEMSKDLRQAGIDVHPIVLRMHDKNGLWEDCMRGFAIDTVDRDLEQFVKSNGITTEQFTDEKTGETKTRNVTPQLAGSTISFDRAFINAHLPRLADEKVLHYRNLDVSTLNEMAKRCFKGLYDRRPNAGAKKEDLPHRGMADIVESIEVFHHYRNAFDRGFTAYIIAGGKIAELGNP